MYQRKDGNSSFQLELQNEMLERINERLHLSDVEKEFKLHLPNNPKIVICPDFYSESSKIIGEIHAHDGKLKAGQRHKIASDILKLHLYDTENLFQKYYAVCSKDEYDYLYTGNNYLAEAMRTFQIHPLFIDIGEEKREELRRVMEKQNMFSG